MKIYINLSKKEVRQISFANSFWDVRRWTPLLMFVVILMILSMLSFVFLDPANISAGTSIMGMITVICAAYIGLRALNAWLAIFSYWRKNTNNVPDYLETNDDEITYYSQDLRNVYCWGIIQNVYETKNFFFLVISKEVKLAIPRRCFADQSQLDSFVTILQINITKKRLHLKHYPIGVSAPDSLGEVAPISTEKTDEEIFTESDSGVELLTLHFFLHTNDVIFLFLRQYYTSRSSIIANIIGLLFVGVFIRDVYDDYLFKQKWSFIIFAFILLAIGLLLLFLIPIMAIKNIAKHYGKNSNTNKELTFQFFHEFYLAFEDNSSTQFYWKNLVKIADRRTAYWLYITKKKVHIIPKRVFADDKDKMEIMKSLLRDCSKGV